MRRLEFTFRPGHNARFDRLERELTTRGRSRAAEAGERRIRVVMIRVVRVVIAPVRVSLPRCVVSLLLAF